MTADQPTIRVHPEVHFTILDNEAVLLHALTEEYYSLDETSTRMWVLLAEHGNQEAVLQIMLQEFSIDEPTLRRDIQHFIDQCTAEKLLIIS